MPPTRADGRSDCCDACSDCCAFTRPARWLASAVRSDCVAWATDWASFSRADSCAVRAVCNWFRAFCNVVASAIACRSRAAIALS